MGQRGRRRFVLLLAVLLVAAVLLVRERTLTGLDRAPEAAVLVRGPGPPVLSPAEVATAALGDVAPTATGDGVLPLGAPAAELSAAGWDLRPGAHGCTRLRAARAADGSELGGWVREGRLVSVHVLAGRAAAGTPSPAGVLFGEPVDRLGGVERTRHPSGTGEVVGTARWTSAADRTVVVSDLGTGGVRWAEVRLPAGGPCILDPAAAGVDPPPSAFRPVGEVTAALEDGEPAGLRSWLGAPVARVPDVEVTSREAPAAGCERLRLGQRWLDVHGGVVVLAAWEGDGEGLVPAGPRTVAGVLERVDRVATVGVADDGTRTAVDYLQRSWVPPGVDAFAVTEPPVVERLELGPGCPTGSRR